MKKIILLCVILAFCNPLFAQPQSVTLSVEDVLIEQIYMPKNGNTFCFNLRQNHIKCVVFDTSRKMILNRDYSLPIDHYIMAYHFNAILEVDDEIVVFTSALTSEPIFLKAAKMWHPFELYRIILDANTGDLKKVETIAHMKRNYGLNVVHPAEQDLGNFYIIPDTLTGDYAIVKFNGYYPKRNEEGTSTITIYDRNHTKKREILYGKDIYKNADMRFCGAFYYNKDFFICSNDFVLSSRSNNHPVYLSVLRDGASDFEVRKLDISPFENLTLARFLVDKENDIIKMATHTIYDKGYYYFSYGQIRKTESYITYIDAKTLNITKTEKVFNNLANEHAKSAMGANKNVKFGLPLMYWDKDYNACFVSMTMTGKGKATYFSFTYVNEKGEEQAGYAVKIGNRGAINPFTYNEYYETDYITTDNGNYLIFNDNLKNYEKTFNENFTRMGRVSFSNTIIYKIGDSPTKYLPFGKTEENRFVFSDITFGYFDRRTNTYVVPIIVNNDGDKKEKVAWIKF